MLNICRTCQVRRVEKLIDEIRGSHCFWILLPELRSLHKVVREIDRALRQASPTNQLRTVCNELRMIQVSPAPQLTRLSFSAKAGGAHTVSRTVQAIDNVAGFLKLQFNEKCCTHTDAPLMHAQPIVTAFCNSCVPVIPPALVRLTIEEIQIVLADEELRFVNRIGDRISASVVQF